MTHRQFLILVSTLIVLLVAGLAIQRHGECLQYGGPYCKGPEGPAARTLLPLHNKTAGVSGHPRLCPHRSARRINSALARTNSSTAVQVRSLRRALV
jgi:hypothetical protein